MHQGSFEQIGIFKWGSKKNRFASSEKILAAFWKMSLNRDWLSPETKEIMHKIQSKWWFWDRINGIWVPVGCCSVNGERS